MLRAQTLRVVGSAREIERARGRWRAFGAVALIWLGDIAALALTTILFHEPASWTFVGAVVVALLVAGCYQLRFTLSALDEAPRLAATIAIAAIAAAPVAAGRADVPIHAALVIAAVVVMRCGTYAIVRARRRHGLNEPTLIAGSGHVGIEIAHLIAAHPEFGLSGQGFAGAPFPGLPLPLLGDLRHLDEVVHEYGIRRVIVAFGPTREADLVPVLRTAMLRDVQVHIVPRFFEVGVAPRGADVDDLWGIPVYRVRQAALQRWAWRFKRATDIVVAGALLVLTAPVMVAAAIAIRLAGPGPILFRQRRIGQHGDEFQVLKFRTLPVDHVDETWNTDAADYRGFAWFLRRTSIDELPQLWNVLRGDMSIVGPRPERGYLVEQFNDEVHGYRDRHRLPVGLTGWAQVHGLRGDTSLRERVRFDNQYIEHWSLWRDIVIMMRTVGAVFRSPKIDSPPDVETPGQLDFGVAATASRGDVEPAKADEARAGK